MANPWVRLWVDMPNDPKFRTIAQKSKQSISSVIAVYVHMLCCASNATERGRTQGWDDEDIASALDMDCASITAIREAMEGKLLEGDRLTGWGKRQPIKEDGSAERGKAWREARKAEEERLRTLANANERPEEIQKREDTEEIKIKKEPKSKTEARGTRIPSDWTAPEAYIEFCKANRPDLDTQFMQDKFRDYWHAKPGKDGLKLDWLGTWRNFIRSERAPQARGSPNGYQTANEKQKSIADRLTGGGNRERTIIDIN